MKKIINVIFSVIFSVLIISTIIKFTVGFKQLYYFDIEYLNIPVLSGLSKEDIKKNYDYMIDYNLDKDNKEFELPSIKSSENGKIHFEEVRNIFQILNKIFKISLVLSIIGLVINILNKNIEFLKTTSKALIVIPLILMLPIVVNFEGSFVLFHKRQKAEHTDVSFGSEAGAVSVPAFRISRNDNGDDPHQILLFHRNGRCSHRCQLLHFGSTERRKHEYA